MGINEGFYFTKHHEMTLALEPLITNERHANDQRTLRNPPVC